MPPFTFAPLSGRYLSFAEREEIAILHAQHCGVREIARPLGRSPSTLEGAASQRGNPGRESGVSSHDRSVARGSAYPPTKGYQACS